MSMRRTTSLLISRPNAFEICSAILRQPHARVAPFHLDHRSNQLAGGTFGPRTTGSLGAIQDDICASPKPGEGATASKPWVSRPFYAYAWVTPKACRIPAVAGSTRSDWGPVAANAA